MRVEIRKNISKNPLRNWYYVVVGSNNEDMNVSQPYFSKSNCKRAAKQIADLMGIEVKDTTAKPYKSYGAGK
jgi:hypothetical protein